MPDSSPHSKPQPEPHPHTLIGAYLAGELSVQDAARVGAYLEAHPKRRGILAGVWASIRTNDVADAPDTNAAADRLFARLDRDRVQRRRSLRRGGQRTNANANAESVARRFMAMGAFVALLLVSGTVFYGVRREVAPHPPVQRYETAPGQRSTVRLADGSTMMLAPSTSVTVTSTGIDVTGEAYFTVMSRASHPFVVRTKNAVVRVLGTQFAVRQYPNESQSRVVVEDGKITLHARHGSNTSDPSQAMAVLSARMLAQISDSGVTVSSGIAIRDYTSWTHGMLVFNGVTLREAVQELSRAYGNDIRIADSTLATQRMRMEVSVAEVSLSRVLELIGKANDAHYTREGRTYVLIPGRMAPSAPESVPQRHQIPQPEQQYGR